MIALLLSTSLVGCTGGDEKGKPDPDRIIDGTAACGGVGSKTYDGADVSVSGADRVMGLNALLRSREEILGMPPGMKESTHLGRVR